MSELQLLYVTARAAGHSHSRAIRGIAARVGVDYQTVERVLRQAEKQSEPIGFGDPRHDWRRAA